MSRCATAERALHEAQPRTLLVAVVLAVVLHAVAFVAVPDLSFEPYVLIDAPPPPPRQIDFVLAPLEKKQEVRKPPAVRDFVPVESADENETIDSTVLVPIDEMVSIIQDDARPDSFVVFDDPPVLVMSVEPDYPELARQAELEGEVGLLIVVDETGRVERAKVVRSVHGLDEAAVAAVLQWRFEPARQRDVPVRVQVFQTVRFRLRG
jgi:TonB family protein